MENRYPELFRRLTIRGTTFRNRVFAAPTSCTPDSGDVTRSPDIKQIMFLEDKARGGAAAVIANETSICLTACKKINTGCIAVMPAENSGHVNFVKLANVIARHGAVPGIELQHAGYYVAPFNLDGGTPKGPSPFTAPDGTQCGVLSKEDLREIVEQYVDAAKAMERAGFKIIMIHGGHGWLLAQFLSAATNHRTDEYGGSLENRARLSVEVLRAIREALSPRTILEFRVSGDEHVEGGTDTAELLALTKLVKPYIDILHVSSGAAKSSAQYTFSGIFIPRGANLELARAVKKENPDLIVATVGGYNDPELMNRIIRDGDADIVYMGRQLMADPQTPNKWIRGLEDEVIPCTRCLNCIGRFAKGVKGCDVNPSTGMNLYDLNLPGLPAEKRRVIVVGGGPGGMSAALEAHRRGHEVTIYEKTGALGGTLNYVEGNCFKQDLTAYKNRLIHLVHKRGIPCVLGTEVTAELLDALEPDVVLCAVGADPLLPPIPGLRENAFTPRQVYEQGLRPGGNIVILGGGLTGVEEGLSLAEQGNHVTVIEMSGEAAAEANAIHKPSIHTNLERLRDNITCLLNTKCTEVLPGAVRVTDESGSREIPADFILNALGQRPNSETVEALAACRAPFFEAFGDCAELGQLRGAVHGGFYRAIDVM